MYGDCFVMINLADPKQIELYAVLTANEIGLRGMEVVSIGYSTSATGSPLPVFAVRPPDAKSGSGDSYY